MSELPDGLIEGFGRRRLPGEGVEIDALVGGSGPPLLLLHGSADARDVAAIAPHPAQRFTVVVPDLRGYGRSDKSTGAPSTPPTRSSRWPEISQHAQALGFSRFAVAGTTAVPGLATGWRPIIRRR